tara:strand:+ start:1348 stop:1944 length:597 start_codon:yes stop_codon:yes gene_type:complete
MRKVNNFMKSNILTLYVGILLIFFMLMLSACEKEPIEPYSPPQAVNPLEIEGLWEITKFYMLEEGFRLDVSAWVEYVNDSTFNIGTIEFNGIAEFDLIYGTRAEGYEPSMRWGDNHNSTLQDTSSLGWNWRAEKPLCNITDYTYEYNPAQYFLGMNLEEWTTTYKTENKWIIENTRNYNDELELTGEHYQYRELTLER